MPVDVPCTGARSADFPLVLKAWSLTETHVPPRRSQRTGPRGVLGEAPTESRDATRTPHQVPFGPRGTATSRRALGSVHSIRVTACRWGASAPVGAPAPHSLVSLLLLPEDLYDVIRVERRVPGAPGFVGVKIGPSGDGADEDAVALDDSKDREDLPSSLLTPRTGRRPQARPVSRRPVCEVTTVWPERSPRHTAVASPRCAGEPTLQRCRRRSS